MSDDLVRDDPADPFEVIPVDSTPQAIATPAEQNLKDRQKEMLRPHFEAAARDPNNALTSNTVELEQVLDSVTTSMAQDSNTSGRTVSNALTVTIVFTHLATYWAFAQWLAAQELSFAAFNFGGILPHALLIGTTAIPIVSRFFPKFGAMLASFLK